MPTASERLFDVGEVNIPQSAVLRALRMPKVDIDSRVRRFGFEYEMFPRNYRGDYPEVDRDEDGYHDDEYDESDICDNDSCNVPSCVSARQARDARQRATGRPVVRQFTPQDLIDKALEADLIEDRSRHSYHCDCSTCSHGRTWPLLTAQTDCTVSVEFVSRIIDLADFQTAREDIDRWVQVMADWKQEGGWMPDGTATCGNHVHVSKEGDDGHYFSEVEKVRARQNFNALYAVFDWSRVADGGCGGIRPYNQKPNKSHPDGGSWVSDRGYGTFEHRLWNTPRDPERLWAHLGMSLAMTRFGFALATAMPEFTFWTEHRVESRYYGDATSYGISSETERVLVDNISDVVTALRSYVPTEQEFDITHDVLANLRVA